ncbi:NTPase KAP family P-loop domain-containing protein 1 [Neosynchiropus ocellatus]
MAAQVLLLLLALIFNTHAEVIRRTGWSQYFYMDDAADFCSVHRWTGEGKELLSNSSDVYWINTLDASDSGLYQEQCWTLGNLTLERNTTLLVCDDQKIRDQNLDLNVGQTVELTCDGVGPNQGVQWAYENDRRGGLAFIDDETPSVFRHQLVKNKPSLLLTVDKPDAVSYFCLERHQLRYTCDLSEDYLLYVCPDSQPPAKKLFAGGENLTLSCGNNSQTRGVHWFMRSNRTKGRVFDVESRQLDNMYISDSSLVISNISLQDSGHFWCVVLTGLLYDVFAFALSKALTKVSSPATVGLYSSCENRIHTILQQMEVFMNNEAERIEQEYRGGSRPRSRRASFAGFVALVCRMLFYRPVWTEENQNYSNVRFTYVDFSAWHFAGSDLLWAALAIRLFQSMQVSFGKLQVVLYRVAQYDEEDEVKKKIVTDGPNSWRSKKICCCPLWCLTLICLLVPVFILVVLLTVELPKHQVNPGDKVDGKTGTVSFLEGLFIAALGVPAASAVRFAIRMGKNLIFTQDLNIKQGMDNQRVSKKLGFMNEVRKEMWLLTRFIEFMEIFERRKIRVVLRITNLDRCSPHKIVAVLEAINILLSDEDSPFISILAVNPDVLVEKVNFADGCFSREDRAYALLNRIVTLAFTIPPLSDHSKHGMFCSLTNNCRITEDTGGSTQRTRRQKKDVSVVEIVLDSKESKPLIDPTRVQLNVTEEELNHLLKGIMNNNEQLSQYMLDDAMSMRRVINSIQVTVIIMKALKTELPKLELIAAWVVLANYWPCRLSWILQCVEDNQQRADIDGDTSALGDDSKTLWEVFSESKAELYVISAEIEELLEMDEDPEMFEKFLRVDFQFTVRDLETFEVATVNLNRSIKRELAQIRGTSRLKDSGWMRNLAPLPITRVVNMSAEDVGKELQRMDFAAKYIDIVKDNDLKGAALLFGNTEDLKELLDMNFGEWTTFRLHFLGLPAHLQPQQKNIQTPKSLLKSHPVHLRHISSRYSSNPSSLHSST